MGASPGWVHPPAGCCFRQSTQELCGERDSSCEEELAKPCFLKAAGAPLRLTELRADLYPLAWQKEGEALVLEELSDVSLWL